MPTSLSPTKAWATSTYSLMTTRAGTSGRCMSSKAPARSVAAITFSMRASGHASTSWAAMTRSSASRSRATPPTSSAKSALSGAMPSSPSSKAAPARWRRNSSTTPSALASVMSSW